MKIRTISKLLAISLLAFTASASQAEIDVGVTFSWETSPGSFGVQHGDFYPKEDHTADTKHNNKWKMWNVAGESWKDDLVNAPGKNWPDGDPNVVRWGYGGKDNKEIDLSRRTGSNTLRTSGLVIDNAMGEITYWNNYLNEDFYTLTFVTLNIEFTVNGETVVSPLTMYIERENEKLKKKGTVIDVDNGGSYVYFDSNFTFTHDINGVAYEFTFNDLTVMDVYNNKAITATSDCGDTPLSSCYEIGGKVKASSKNTQFVISFGNVTATAVPEPETYAMMLAGLGLIGTVARRRRNIIRN